METQTPNSKLNPGEYIVERKPKTHFTFLMIAVCVGMGAVFTVWLLSMRATAEIDANSVEFTATKKVSGALLFLSPLRQSAGVGQTASVTVNLSSTVDISQTNVVIHYDPTTVDVSSVNPNAPDTEHKYLQPGDGHLPTLLGYSNDTKAGRITFSATTSAGQAYHGNAKLATLEFRAKKAGQSTITIVYASNSATDSSVTDVRGGNALIKATPATLIIQ